MYNLHIYIREFERFLVITHEWKYNNLVNSISFYLSEFEEMKRYIYHLETRTLG